MTSEINSVTSITYASMSLWLYMLSTISTAALMVTPSSERLERLSEPLGCIGGPDGGPAEKPGMPPAKSPVMRLPMPSRRERMVATAASSSVST